MIAMQKGSVSGISQAPFLGGSTSCDPLLGGEGAYLDDGNVQQGIRHRETLYWEGEGRTLMMAMCSGVQPLSGIAPFTST